MVNFCVTAVRYNEDKDHIEAVKVHEEKENGAKIGPGRTVDRAFVADLIRKGLATFQTRVQVPDGWAVGADIHVIEDQYLSTDRNSRTRDNLGNLPPF